MFYPKIGKYLNINESIDDHNRNVFRKYLWPTNYNLFLPELYQHPYLFNPNTVQDLLVQFNDVALRSMTSITQLPKNRYVYRSFYKVPDLVPEKIYLKSVNKLQFETTSNNENFKGITATLRKKSGAKYCKLQLNDDGKKRSVQFDLHPLIEGFINRAMDKLSVHSAKHINKKSQKPKRALLIDKMPNDDEITAENNNDDDEDDDDDIIEETDQLTFENISKVIEDNKSFAQESRRIESLEPKNDSQIYRLSNTLSKNGHNISTSKKKKNKHEPKVRKINKTTSAAKIQVQSHGNLSETNLNKNITQDKQTYTSDDKATSTNDKIRVDASTFTEQKLASISKTQHATNERNKASENVYKHQSEMPIMEQERKVLNTHEFTKDIDDSHKNTFVNHSEIKYFTYNDSTLGENTKAVCNNCTNIQYRKLPIVETGFWEQKDMFNISYDESNRRQETEKYLTYSSSNNRNLNDNKDKDSANNGENSIFCSNEYLENNEIPRKPSVHSIKSHIIRNLAAKCIYPLIKSNPKTVEKHSTFNDLHRRENSIFFNKKTPCNNNNYYKSITNNRKEIPQLLKHINSLENVNIVLENFLKISENKSNSQFNSSNVVKNNFKDDYKEKNITFTSICIDKNTAEEEPSDIKKNAFNNIMSNEINKRINELKIPERRSICLNNFRKPNLQIIDEEESVSQEIKNFPQNHDLTPWKSKYKTVSSFLINENKFISTVKHESQHNIRTSNDIANDKRFEIIQSNPVPNMISNNNKAVKHSQLNLNYKNVKTFEIDSNRSNKITLSTFLDNFLKINTGITAKPFSENLLPNKIIEPEQINFKLITSNIEPKKYSNQNSCDSSKSGSIVEYNAEQNRFDVNYENNNVNEKIEVGISQPGTIQQECNLNEENVKFTNTSLIKCTQSIISSAENNVNSNNNNLPAIHNCVLSELQKSQETWKTLTSSFLIKSLTESNESDHSIQDNQINTSDEDSATILLSLDNENDTIIKNNSNLNVCKPGKRKFKSHKNFKQYVVTKSFSTFQILSEISKKGNNNDDEMPSTSTKRHYFLPKIDEDNFK